MIEITQEQYDDYLELQKIVKALDIAGVSYMDVVAEVYGDSDD